ncbi:hypothetical protein EST38_g8306 [Candolleomyces aberdarensis]|uniref:Uncharacterized protein n=1 Tax=Candolleomyces aberdarensis TaxID=2316362 RepID=A0A4Q2DF55_9AGAR|nr:hypothetical protein EST38_g8306 [Candolleomyces aberdarensis]
MDSPFTHHFNTNYVPSDNEIPAIRDAIYKGKEVLNDIDQKTHEIERRMEELRQELQALAECREAQKREVDELMALLSPIKRIDDDILTSIFLSVLDVVNRDHLNISKKHPAVVISHVCQRCANQLSPPNSSGVICTFGFLPILTIRVLRISGGQR